MKRIRGAYFTWRSVSTTYIMYRGVSTETAGMLIHPGDCHPACRAPADCIPTDPSGAKETRRHSACRPPRRLPNRAPWQSAGKRPGIRGFMAKAAFKAPPERIPPSDRFGLRDAAKPFALPPAGDQPPGHFFRDCRGTRNISRYRTTGAHAFCDRGFSSTYPTGFKGWKCAVSSMGKPPQIETTV